MRTTTDKTRQLASLGGALLLAGLAGNAYAVDLVTETFETDGEGSRYTSNSFDELTAPLPDPNLPFGNEPDYFIRALGPQPLGFAFPILSGPNPTPANFWASEDATGNNLNPGAPGILRLNDLNVAGSNNLTVHVYFADPWEGTTRRWESTDFVRVQYAMDGNSGGTDVTAGTYSTIGQFVGDNAGGPTLSGNLRQDTNLDGISHDEPGARIVTRTFSEFSFSIPATGTTLSVQIQVPQVGSSEEFAFDHIRITGDAATTAAPVLAAIEMANLSYTEEDPATQITNTITVTDSDSANIESAIIQITGGNDPTEDELALVGAAAGITVASYVPATGTLALSGTATKAEYQAALRLVTYVNNDLFDPSLQTRTVSFSVNDGSSSSNTVSRDIVVTPDILQGTIPHKESFETDGEGERYLTNGFNNPAANSLFDTVNTQPSNFLDAFTGADGSWFFAAEKTAINLDNPLFPDDKGYIKLHDLDASGFANLEVTVNLAVSRFGTLEWDDDDFVEVQYAFDGDIGASEDTGTYTTIGRFLGALGGDELTQDADLDGSPDVGGAQPTAAFTPFTFSIPDTGSLLSVRIVVRSGGSEELGIDCIEVDAVAPPCPTPVEASLAMTRVLRRERVIRGETVVRSGALGYLDVGVSGTDFAASAATVTLGDDVIAIPAGGLAASGSGDWDYLSGDGTYRVRLSQIGSTSRHRLRIDVADSELVNGDALVSFENADIRAEATVTVASDRFLRGRGASAGPPLAIEYFRSRLLGSGSYAARYRGRIPFDGSGPGAAPDLLVCMGAFSQAIDAADVTVTSRGFRFINRDVSRGRESGVLRLTVDVVSGLVVADVRADTLATIVGTEVPITLGFGQDGDDHAVQIVATVVAPDALRY